MKKFVFNFLGIVLVAFVLVAVVGAVWWALIMITEVHPSIVMVIGGFVGAIASIALAGWWDDKFDILEPIDFDDEDAPDTGNLSGPVDGTSYHAQK